MKKVMLLGLAVALIMAPFALSAQVESAAGSMTLGAHIDFTGRYVAEDNLDGVGGDADPADIEPDEIYGPGYETFNLEAAILYVIGRVGDDVDYVIGLGLVMPVYARGVVRPSGVATLLDARICWSVTDTIALNVGRYIPHTSMSQQPHQLSVHHLVDPPMMIVGGDYNPVLLPLPRYQTGVGIQAAMGPATITWDFFNGNEVVVVDNLTETDKSKGGVVKVAVDIRGFHGGVWYMSEYSDIPEGLVIAFDGMAVGADDQLVTMWGVELLYGTERFLVSLEYFDTLLDLLDTDVPDLRQVCYYLMAAVGLGPVQVVLRYDFAEAGVDEFVNDYYDEMDIDISVDMGDQQANYTVGVNYPLNDNTTVALNYAYKQPEIYEGDFDGDGDTEDIDLPNINEISLMVELDIL